MESRNDVVWAKKSMEPYTAEHGSVWLGTEENAGGFHCTRGLLLTTPCLVLKAQEVSLHFPRCHDRYDAPMHERTESTERVDIVSKPTLGGQALARMQECPIQ
ncbi:hypothetical protein GMDG_04204 [Pseudogymnoascus destructans 20631-21]|uniref:Uncharacterized protein n=1 Tax=Pseudogymnoascus destructans (strain ATCC MYA-4855 / 20631-21) TaxID=658429 RepID=L8GAP6_PSED2|nr:hypothetical protein GMDG_04204 [Pseudogymnoascus destructans 20631-21]